MQRFPMSLDTGRRVLLAVILGALVIACVGIAAQGGVLPSSGLLAVLAVTVAGTWASAPTALAIDAGTLRVERHVGTALTVPLTTISDVEMVGRLGLAFLLGRRDLFGEHTPGWSRAFGWIRVYRTRNDGGVLVRRRGAWPLYLTPDDPERFVAALRSVCAPFGMLAPR